MQSGRESDLGVEMRRRLTRYPAFGSDVDYAQLLKQYGSMGSQDGSPTARRYSPNVVTSVDSRVLIGDPNPDRISTS